MNDQDILLLKQGFDSANQTIEEFTNFKLETSITLLGHQLQLFQSLSTIILAFWALVIAKGEFQIDLWLAISLMSSLFLILYAPAYVRETIDRADENLRTAADALERMKNLVYEKIGETIKKGDISIWNTFVRREASEKQSTTLNYGSEIIMLLFSISLFSAIASIVNHYLISLEPMCLVTTLIFLLAVTYSFYGWSLRTTTSFSKILQTISRHK